MAHPRVYGILLLALAFLVRSALPASPAPLSIHREKAWGLLVGYGIQPFSWAGSVPEKVKVATLYPTLAVGSVSYGPWKIGLEMEGLLGFRTDEGKGTIVGASPLVRIMYTAWPGFAPYLEAGGGGSYNNFDLKGMGSRWNFTLEGGAGSQLKIRKGLGLRIEYRLLHLSNGGLAEANRALNANLFLLGAWYTF